MKFVFFSFSVSILGDNSHPSIFFLFNFHYSPIFLFLPSHFCFNMQIDAQLNVQSSLKSAHTPKAIHSIECTSYKCQVVSITLTTSTTRRVIQMFISLKSVRYWHNFYFEGGRLHRLGLIFYFYFFLIKATFKKFCKTCTLVYTLHGFMNFIFRYCALFLFMILTNTCRLCVV